jgi:nicotinamide-nucleotide amidase
MIGDELLSGDVVDRNKAWLGRRCRALGVEVIRAITIRDREAEIVAGMREAAESADLCLVSGGLGPTTDDLTAACAALAAGVELVRRPELAARLEAFFTGPGRGRGRALVEANLKQADLPAGAIVLDNPIGTAAGFGLELGTCWLFSMPGVPRELRLMMSEQIEPRVRERFQLTPIPRRIYRAIGSGESSVQQNVQGVLARARERSRGLANMFVHYRASYPEVQLILEATPGNDSDEPGASAEELASLDEPLRAAIGPALYLIRDGSTGSTGSGSDSEQEDESIAKLLVTRLIERGLTLVSAESCTGGGIGAAVTSVAGSSACFLGGVIAYANAVKIAQLGVSAQDLETHGAVSEPVARAMAEGARTRLNASIGVSTTGIAGPGGGSEAKPIGTVDIAVATPVGTSYKRLQLLGSREMIRHAATLWALKLVLDQLDTLSSWDNAHTPS